MSHTKGTNFLFAVCDAWWNTNFYFGRPEGILTSNFAYADCVGRTKAKNNLYYSKCTSSYIMRLTYKEDGSMCLVCCADEQMLGAPPIIEWQPVYMEGQ